MGFERTQDDRLIVIEVNRQEFNDAFLGSAIVIHFDYVAEISRAENGKFRQVVSTIGR